MPIREIARAKINLTLSVLGRRPDGYHELDSLVTFAGAADLVTLHPGAQSGVTVSGPFAADIVGENLAAKALALLREADPGLRLGRVEIVKNLPVAAGLGGGSADAAAVLRAVRARNGDRARPFAWHDLAVRLGADVAVCLDNRPARIGGVGERVQPLEGALLELPAVLVNPRQPLSTARVFRQLDAALLPADGHSARVDPWPRLDRLVEALRARGNDLERPAIELLPVIADIKAALTAQEGCRIAAMSGSGPTCFGIFANGRQATVAAAALASAEPGWWIVPTSLDWPA